MKLPGTFDNVLIVWLFIFIPKWLLYTKYLVYPDNVIQLIISDLFELKAESCWDKAAGSNQKGCRRPLIFIVLTDSNNSMKIILRSINIPLHNENIMTMGVLIWISKRCYLFVIAVVRHLYVPGLLLILVCIDLNRSTGWLYISESRAWECFPPFALLADCCAQAMLSMLTDPALSDVCLVVEGVDVAAHKAVLGELSWAVFVS